MSLILYDKILFKGTWFGFPTIEITQTLLAKAGSILQMKAMD